MFLHCIIITFVFQIYTMKNIYFFLGLIFLFSSCKKDLTNTITPDTSVTPYILIPPLRFPQPYISYINPLTVEGIALGRRLFYDQILSSNFRSCSYCHPQELSFTSSIAEHGLDTTQYWDILPWINLAWKPFYGWNGGIKEMDHIGIADLGPKYLNSNMTEVLAKLKADSTYSAMFKKAFNGEDVLVPDKIQEKIAFAIAQFAKTIVSSNSKFDKYLMGTAQLTPQEANGYDIFYSEKGDCFHCHGTILLTDNGRHNIGLDTVFNNKYNQGYFTASGLAKDMGLMMTPTLRNVAQTSPYMHDGRYKTLEEVIEHYNSGVHKTPTLDPIMTLPGKEMGLLLSNSQKADLKAFLLTFTDSTLLFNPQFSRPK